MYLTNTKIQMQNTNQRIGNWISTLIRSSIAPESAACCWSFKSTRTTWKHHYVVCTCEYCVACARYGARVSYCCEIAFSLFSRNKDTISCLCFPCFLVPKVLVLFDSERLVVRVYSTYKHPFYKLFYKFKANVSIEISTRFKMEAVIIRKKPSGRRRLNNVHRYICVMNPKRPGAYNTTGLQFSFGKLRRLFNAEYRTWTLHWGEKKEIRFPSGCYRNAQQRKWIRAFTWAAPYDSIWPHPTRAKSFPPPPPGRNPNPTPPANLGSVGPLHIGKFFYPSTHTMEKWQILMKNCFKNSNYSWKYKNCPNIGSFFLCKAIKITLIFPLIFLFSSFSLFCRMWKSYGSWKISTTPTPGQNPSPPHQKGFTPLHHWDPVPNYEFEHRQIVLDT